MTITSLFDLRRQLAVYLGEKMPDCDILPTLPTIRQPLPADGTTLVLTVQKLRRAEGLLPACGALLLEVTLQVTACHRDDSDACEAALEQLAALDLSGLEALDAAALTDITAKLAQIDPAALQAALAKLQQVDIERLNGALAQMENVLADLDGLDTEALNTAIRNLNKTLGPLLALFDR